jgi:hypothetical protein
VAPGGAGGGGEDLSEEVDRLRVENHAAQEQLLEARTAKQEAERERDARKHEVERLEAAVRAKDADLRTLRGGAGDVQSLVEALKGFLDTKELNNTRSAKVAQGYKKLVDMIQGIQDGDVCAPLKGLLLENTDLAYGCRFLLAVPGVCARENVNLVQVPLQVSDALDQGTRDRILECCKLMMGTAELPKYTGRIQGLRESFGAAATAGYGLAFGNGVWQREAPPRPPVRPAGPAKLVYLLDSYSAYVRTTGPAVVAGAEAMHAAMTVLHQVVKSWRAGLDDAAVNAFKAQFDAAHAYAGRVMDGVRGCVYQAGGAALPLDKWNPLPELDVGALMERGLGTLVQHHSVFGWVAGQPQDAKAILPERFRGMDAQEVVRTLRLACGNLLTVDASGIQPCSRGALTALGIDDAGVLDALGATDP